MADIGSLLRETRIRNKIDITTVEEATKIRAKYLRALENEEWVVLPGTDLRQDLPAHVRAVPRASTRTCSSTSTARASRSPRTSRWRRSRPAAPDPRPRAARGPAVARDRRALVVVVAFVAFLLVLGLTGGDEDKGGIASRHQATHDHAARATLRPSSRPPGAAADAARSATCASRWSPARNVWVCVVDAKGTARVARRDPGGGRPRGPVPVEGRSGCTVGNGGGGPAHRRQAARHPDRAEPLGYLVRPLRDERAAREQPAADLRVIA